MRAPSTKAIGTLLLLIISILLFLIVNRPKLTEAKTEVYDSEPTSNYMVEAENKRFEEAEERDRIKRMNRHAAEKRNSVECQFWKQQQTSKSTKKTEEKIKQYCELAETEQPQDDSESSEPQSNLATAPKQ